jgi:hypothetical protein
MQHRFRTGDLPGANYPCGNADTNTIWRQVTCNDRPRSDDTSVANRHPRCDYDMRADPYVVSDANVGVVTGLEANQRAGCNAMI